MIIKKPVVAKKAKPKYKKATKMKKLFKKMGGTSKLETKFEELLIELGVPYIKHFRFAKREFDFCIPEYNLLIEIHGDHFHCNPELNVEVRYPYQKRSIKNDLYKIKIVENSLDYRLIVFWENDINKNYSQVVMRLLAELK